ncbi:MAG: PEP-CTERM sorting domain-containing protein [Gemmataceae bacterium]|nr:PEP-CTERM sorting domain-containing protein [Gemmataceae bacterium]
MAAIVLAGIAPARADYALFTDRAAFVAAAGGVDVISFEGLAPAGDFADYGFLPNVLIQKGVSFRGITDGDNYLYVVDPLVSPDLYDWGSGAVLLGPSLDFSDVARIDVSLPAGTTAIGMDLMAIRRSGRVYAPGEAPIELSFLGGPTFTLTTGTYPARTFFGVLFDAPVSGLSIRATDSSYALVDNFTIGSVVPEPSCLLLFAIGAAGMTGAAWRRRKLPV